MREFFHGWRRKVGVVTLLMVCGLTGMWIRSRTVCDTIGIPIGQRQTVVVSLDGRAYWYAYNVDDRNWFTFTGSELNNTMREGQYQMRADFAEQPSIEYTEWAVTYLPVAIGLTILSAYVILWKPRMPGAGQKCEPSAAETPQPSLTDFRGKSSFGG